MRPKALTVAMSKQLNFWFIGKSSLRKTSQSWSICCRRYEDYWGLEMEIMWELAKRLNFE